MPPLWTGLARSRFGHQLEVHSAIRESKIILGEIGLFHFDKVLELHSFRFRVISLDPDLLPRKRFLAATWHGAYSFLIRTAIPQGHIQLVFATFVSNTTIRKNTRISGVKQ